MADRVARPRVELNTKQIESQIDNLEAKAKDLKKQLKAAFELGQVDLVPGLEKELKKTENEVKSLKKEIISVDHVLKNLNNTSRDQVQKALNKQSEVVRKLSRDHKNYRQEVEKLKTLKGTMANFNKELMAQEGMFKRMANGFNNYFGIITAGIASLSGIAFSARKAVDMANTREENKDELKAITGLGDAAADSLEKNAIRISTTVDENGIRIKQSADDILEAYKLMGSAKAELLGDPEALHNVTKEALILAQAAKMETAPAVESLANIMNQFGAPASEASKYINILAAGSQAGAAEVVDLADSIIRSGAAAKAANVSIEEEVALIETLAEKGVKAEKAGTGLKTFLLKLQSGADETNPAVVGMSKALENLSKENLSAAEMTERFGLETYTVAQLLINNRNKFDELTEAVTGTNTAYEQAATNSQNNAAKLAQAKNKASEYAIELGKKLQPAMTHLVSTGTLMLKVLSATIDFFKEYGAQVLMITGIIGAYAIAVNASIIADKLKILWNEKLIGSLKKLYATILANPWAALFAVLSVGLILLTKYTSQVKLSEQELRKQAETQKASNEALQANNELLEKAKGLIGDVTKLKKEEIKDALKMLEIESAIARQQLIKASSDPNVTNEVYNKIANNLTELGKLREKLYERLADIENEEKQRAEEKTETAKQNEEDLQKALWELRKQYGLIKNMELYKKEIAELNNHIARKLLTEEEYQKARKAIYDKYLKVNVVDIDEGLDLDEVEQPKKSTESLRMESEMDYQNQLYQQSLDYQYSLLEQQWANGEVGWTEYYNRINDLDNQRHDLMMNNLTSGMEHYRNIATSILAIQSAKLEKEKNRELASAGDNAQKREEIERKYREKQKQLALKQAVIDMALAELKAVASAPFPLNLPAVAEATLAGAAAIVSINAQEFEQGGYTGFNGRTNDVAGIVHKKEFVANAQATSNPSVKGVLDIINLAQQNGTIATLDLPGAIRNMNQTRGFATGGYTSNATPKQTTPTAPQPNSDLNKAAAAILQAAQVFASKQLVITEGAVRKINQAGIEIEVEKSSYKRK